MGFINGIELAKALKVNKNSIAKKRDELEIPYIKRGTKFYYIDNFEEVLQNRDIIRKSNCNVITIGNNKGGVAKTTTVINLASNLVIDGFTVLIVDMDMQCNLSRHFNKNHIEHNIVRQLDTMDKHVFNIPHDSYRYGRLDLIANNLALEEEFDEKRLNNLDAFLETFKDDYDFIILDTPPSINRITPKCISVSDFVFMVLKPDTYSTSGALNFLKKLEDYDVKLLGGVITANSKRVIADSVNVKEVEDIFLSVNSKICDTQISFSSIFNEISLMGEISITTYQPKHKCCSEYFDITNFVLNNIVRSK